MYSHKGNRRGPSKPFRARRQYGIESMSFQERAEAVVRGVRKAEAENIEAQKRLDYWSTDPTVLAIAKNMLNDSNDAA